MEMLQIATIVSAVNVVLLAGLLYIYLSNYMKLKSGFAAGLIVFASMFMVQNLTAIYCQLMMIEYYSPEMTGISFALNSLEAVGLGALMYISWK
jgi:hypothetical protein